MRYKKWILILPGMMLSLFFLNQVAADTEQEVIGRYDYSSPRASYESLKKAIQNKDFAGVYIHMWKTGIILPTVYSSSMSFGEAISNIEKEHPDLIEAVDATFRITETDFLGESEEIRVKEEEDVSPGTCCFVIVHLKNYRKQTKIAVCKEDGTRWWWLQLGPGGP